MLGLALVSFFAAASPASAATFNVDSTADEPDLLPGEKVALVSTLVEYRILRAAG